MSLIIGAQSGASYDLSWSTIDGGGCLSSGGVYSVRGSCGQADAFATLTEGSYAVTGGFWPGSIHARQDSGIANCWYFY